MTIVQMTNRNDSSVIDSDDTVWNMASTDFNSIFDLGDYSLFLLEQVAANENVPTVMLEQLLYHPAQQIRVVLAGNASVPVDALTVLAQDSSTEVRMTLASNRQAPVEVLQVLAADDDAYVSVRAIGTLERINRAAGVIQIDAPKFEIKLLA